MKKLIVLILLATLAVASVYAADWSNPNPQVSGDKAGPLLLKHEDNMTDLYTGAASKLNQLRNNFSGSSAPASPNTGQPWYDSTNMLFQIYDATCGGWACGGFKSSGSSTFGTAFISSATVSAATVTNLHTLGTFTNAAATVATGTQTISGNIESSGTNSLYGSTYLPNVNGLASKGVTSFGSTGQATVSAAGLLALPNLPHTINGVQIATVNSTVANATAATTATTANRLTDGTNTAHFKYLTGSWNMDTTGSISVAHGLTLSKITSVDVMIVINDGTGLYPFDTQYNHVNTGGFYYADGTNVVCQRDGSGYFDSASFNSATYKIMIWYID